jgi:hypothetical protein
VLMSMSATPQTINSCIEELSIPTASANMGRMYTSTNIATTDMSVEVEGAFITK